MCPVLIGLSAHRLDLSGESSQPSRCSKNTCFGCMRPALPFSLASRRLIIGQTGETRHSELFSLEVDVPQSLAARGGRSSEQSRLEFSPQPGTMLPAVRRIFTNRACSKGKLGLLIVGMEGYNQNVGDELSQKTKNIRCPDREFVSHSVCTRRSRDVSCP
jgi:hypothetical protein